VEAFAMPFLPRLFSLLILLAPLGAYASETREIIYRGQSSEKFELRDETGRGEDSAREIIAEVTLEFGKAPENTNPEETFILRLDEDRLNLTVKSSGRVLISQRMPEIRMHRNRRKISIEAVYRFSFLDLDPIAAVLEAGILQFQAKDQSVVFLAAPDLFERGFTLRLSIMKKRTLASDDLIFDRVLSESNFHQRPGDAGRSLYSAKLADLDVPRLRTGLYEFDLNVSFDSGSEAIVNASDLPKGGRLRAKTQVFASDLRRLVPVAEQPADGI
jgi:hypothetical protein